MKISLLVFFAHEHAEHFMRKTFIIASMLAIFFTMEQCGKPKSATATKDSMPAQTQLQIAESRWPGTTQATLDLGQKIYTSDPGCRHCHGDKGLKKRSEEAWLHSLETMAPKAKLTAEETEAVTRYVLSARAVAMNK